MDKIIQLSAYLVCKPARAYAFFTVANLLEKWLTAQAEIEPRLGGKYELFWQPEDRENNSTLGCKITALASNRFLAFEWRSPKQFKHFANQSDPLTHVVVFFIPEPEETTTVYLVHTGWRRQPVWEEARLWQKQAWQGALQTLEGIVAHDVDPV